MSVDLQHLIGTAGGAIVGKIRLQKVVYLLDQKGMNSGFSYDYHHYGPYSAELTDAMDDEIVFGRVEEEARRRASDGVPYSVFRLPAGTQVDESEALGDLPASAAPGALAAMQRRSATVLELAATIHWLACVENVTDWHSELVRRKGVKTERGRDAEALSLLRELGLPPAAVGAAQ